MQNTNLRGNDKSNEFAQFWKLTIVARWFLLISGPRVRVPGGAPDIERQIVRFGVLFCYVTPKNRGLHGQCTVFCTVGVFIGILCMGWNYFEMRGKFCIRSAESQTELRLYFGVCILQKFQQSSRRDGRFACGGHSLRAGAFLFGIEPFLKLLAQFYTRGLLDMRIGVHQHIPP